MSAFSARPASSVSNSSPCSRTIRGSALTWLAASERSAGQRYGDIAWRLPTRLPADVAAI